MSDNPQVLGLLEEMLDAGKTPEEACRDCPELLPEVRRRWQEFHRLEAQVEALFPGIRPGPGADALVPGLPLAGLPQVSGYEVEAVLGRGGMGVVYKARHLALKRTVALKMLAAGHPHPGQRARFRAEAEAVARLQHPNIVQIHEVGEADGRPFIALEYLAGGSLDKRLAGQPLPPRDAAGLVAALAGAIHLAHSRNLVHRDLKPGNVLLAGEADTPVGQCQPKVTDFGLVRQLDADSGQTSDGVVVGTPSYMAPEQAEGRAGAAGPAADVYALGAILYECLTGRPPFKGATQLETLEEVRSREPAAPSSLNRRVPRDLETICLKCLRKEPERRYSSARELADDLGRFVRGEPVAARPVGRLERVAKWVHRNPTVAGLSAVAALAVVAGTVASVLFGVEASRKADALEKQSIELQAQTRAAQEYARREEESKKDVTRAMLSGLLIPIGNSPLALTEPPLDAGEAKALRQLRATGAPIRLQFLEMALGEPETARRVGRRSDWVVQAVVGCDPSLRADVGCLLIRRIQEPGAPQDVTLACARLGLAVNLGDPGWAERSADAVVVAVRDPALHGSVALVDRDDYLRLAEALAAVSEHLPPARAADRAAEVTDVFLARLQEPAGQMTASHQLERAIVAVSPRLDAAAATRAAEALAALIRRPTTHPLYWPPVCRALAAVCRRLPPAEAAAYANGTVDFVLDARSTTKDKNYGPLHAEALGALCGWLDAARAARVAEALLAILGDTKTLGGVKHDFLVHGSIAEALTGVAEYLDAPGRLQTALGLVLVLRKAEGSLLAREPLRAALVSEYRRLDAAGAARVSDAIVAAVRDPQTSVQVRTLFADAPLVVGGQLDPARAAALEDALVDALVADLADAKSLPARGLLGQALGSVCSRPGARTTARAAGAIVAAIRDPQTPLGLLKPLAEALAAVGGRLTPTDTALHANQAVDALGSLWVARTARWERASVAQALAAVWMLLGPEEAAAHARRTAAELENAIRDANPAMNEHHSLAEALAAVYGHLGPAERVTRANAVADPLVAALRKPRNGVMTISLLSEALAALCVHLDRPGAVRVADALLTALGEPDVRRHQFEFREEMFRKVAVRLDEPDLQRLLDHLLAARRLQRVILDVLGESKHHRFRNTWDYLDWTESNRKRPTGLPPGTNR
jgi:hypothetical protein